MKKFLKLNTDAFINSFKQDINFLYIILADILFYAVTLLMMLFVFPLMVIDRFELFYATLLMQAKATAASFPETMSNLNSLGISFVVSLFLFVLLIILLHAAFKGSIWHLINTRKINFKDFFRNYFLRYVLASIILCISFVALFYLSFQIFKQDYFIIFFLFVQSPFYLGVYFISGAVLLREKKLFVSLKKTLYLMFAKLKYMIIPVCVFLLIFTIILVILVGLSIPLEYIGLPGKYFAPEPGEREYRPTPAKPSDAAPAVTPTPEPARPFTGLIVDGRGLSITPSLGFKILIKDTQEVLYGLSTVSRSAVIGSKGMAGYTRSIEDAKVNSRVGGNPMIVKATSAVGSNRTDVSISKEDAAKIYNANLNSSFLKALKVVVVCGG